MGWNLVLEQGVRLLFGRLGQLGRGVGIVVNLAYLCVGRRVHLRLELLGLK